MPDWLHQLIQCLSTLMLLNTTQKKNKHKLLTLSILFPPKDLIIILLLFHMVLITNRCSPIWSGIWLILSLTLHQFQLHNHHSSSTLSILNFVAIIWLTIYLHIVWQTKVYTFNYLTIIYAEVFIHKYYIWCREPFHSMVIEVLNMVIDQLTLPLLHIHPIQPWIMLSWKPDAWPHMIKHWPR